MSWLRLHNYRQSTTALRPPVKWADALFRGINTHTHTHTQCPLCKVPEVGAVVPVRHICPPAPRSSRRRDDYIMKWGRANEMGRKKKKKFPHQHLPPPPPPGLFIIIFPSARILLNHRDIHPACLSLCFGLSVRKRAMLLYLPFLSSFSSACTCLYLSSI